MHYTHGNKQFVLSSSIYQNIKMNDVDKDTNTSMIRKGCSVNHLLTIVLIPDREKAPRTCYVFYSFLEAMYTSFMCS